MRFFKFIGDIFNVFAKAREIKQNEDTRKKSVIFGITSIVYLIMAVVCAFGGAYLLSFASDSLLAIFILVIALVLLVGALALLLGAVFRLIAQFYINRNAMSWIALAVFIAAAVVAIILILKFVG